MPLNGTPLADLDADLNWQITSQFAPGIRHLSGRNLTLARVISAETGDAMCAPIGTSMLLDVETDAAIGIVLHGYTGPGGLVSVSGLVERMAWSRRFLHFLMVTVFVDLAVGMVMMRVRSSDLPRRAFAQRLGFQFLCGLPHEPDGPAMLYGLTAGDLSYSFTRALRRLAH